VDYWAGAQCRTRVLLGCSKAQPPFARSSSHVTRRPASQYPILSHPAPHCIALLYTTALHDTTLWTKSRSNTHTNPQLHPTRRRTTPPPLSRPAHLDTSVSTARALRRGDPLAPEYSTDTHYPCRRIHLPTPIDWPPPQSPVTALPARRRVAHTLQRL
jgi:hypothetical protein